MLISLSNLAAMGKVQKNNETKTRPVGLININLSLFTNVAKVSLNFAD